MQALFIDIKTPLVVIHVLSVVLGMGSALASDILFNFYSKDKKFNTTELGTMQLLSTVVWYALLGIVLSGIGIVLSDPVGYMYAVKFQTKMVIMGILLVNGFVLNYHIWPHVIRPHFLTAPQETTMRQKAFACGAISLVSWLAVCVLGILDTVPFSFGVLFGAYVFCLCGSIIGALVVEKMSRV